jgi:ribosomal protein L14
MSRENNQEKALDVSALEAGYQTVPLPSEKRQDGRRLVVGPSHAPVAVDLFPEPPALAYVRSRGGAEVLLIAGVRTISAEAQGIRIANADSDCFVSNDGHVIFARTPPPVPAQPMKEGRAVLRYDKDGQEYQQSTIDVAGTPEGTRVHVRGMVRAAPKPEGRGKDRALVFFLEEEDKEKGEVVEHEVYATKKARADLQRRQLKRGDVVEAVMYRHTYAIDTQGGQELTHTRHYLVSVTKVEEKDAKRITSAAEPSQE